MTVPGWARWYSAAAAPGCLVIPSMLHGTHIRRLTASNSGYGHGRRPPRKGGHHCRVTVVSGRPAVARRRGFEPRTVPLEVGMLNPLSYQRLPGPGNWEETRPGCSGCGVFRRVVVLVMPGEGRHPRRRPVLRARRAVRHGLAVEVRGGRGGHGPRRGAGDGTRPGGQAEGDEDSGEDALDGHDGLPGSRGARREPNTIPRTVTRGNFLHTERKEHCNCQCKMHRSGGPEPRQERHPRHRPEHQHRTARILRVPHAHDRAVLPDLRAVAVADAGRALAPGRDLSAIAVVTAMRARAPGRDLRAVAVGEAVRALAPSVHGNHLRPGG